MNVKKVNIVTGIIISLALSLSLSLIGMTMAGHITPVTFLIGFSISFFISCIMSFFFPILKIQKFVADKLGTKYNSISTELVSSLFISFVYAPIMSVIMVFIMTRIANASIDRALAAITPQVEAVSAQHIEKMEVRDSAYETYLKVKEEYDAIEEKYNAMFMETEEGTTVLRPDITEEKKAELELEHQNISDKMLYARSTFNDAEKACNELFDQSRELRQTQKDLEENRPTFLGQFLMVIGIVMVAGYIAGFFVQFIFFDILYDKYGNDLVKQNGRFTI